MIELFVPGRVCLFGEHSDWAGALRREDATIVPGSCLLTSTDQGITAVAEMADDFELTSRLPDGSVRGPYRLPMDASALADATRDHGFASYAAGVVLELWRRFHPGGI